MFRGCFEKEKEVEEIEEQASHPRVCVKGSSKIGSNAHTPRVLPKSAEEIERKGVGVQIRVHRNGKSAEELENAGVISRAGGFTKGRAQRPLIREEIG
jgi:hypothetical protein